MKRRLPALILVLIILLSAVTFVSCDEPSDITKDTTVSAGTTVVPADTTSGNTPKDTTTAKTPEDTGTTPADTTSGGDIPTEPVPEDIDIAGCRIVYSRNAAVSSATVKYAGQLKKLIEAKKAGNVTLTTDYIKAGAEYDRDRVEILIGLTDYAESREAFSETAYGAYNISVRGKKLVISYYSDEALEKAYNKLAAYLDGIAAADGIVIPGSLKISDNVNFKLGALPAYDGGVFGTTYKCSGDAVLVYIEDTDKNEFAGYLDKLKDYGYTEYTTNTISDNSFATFTNEKYTVNVGYYNYENAARLIIEPLAEPVGLEADNVYETVTTSQITMIGLEYTSLENGATKYHSNGLSMLIRLEDGRFVMIDGGFNTTHNASHFLKTIKEQSADYLKPGEKPVIAAWIITHMHGDHTGLLSQTVNFRNEIKVEKFLVNYLSEEERMKAIGSTEYGGNYSSTEGSGWGVVVGASKVFKSEMQNVHVGQVFYIADAKLEVLYTIESYAPKVCNALNTTSLVIKFTFKSGDTFMMTGDATGNAFQICYRMYRGILRSDMLQVAHHGYTTWGNDAGTINGYRSILPEVVLWPQGNHGFPSYKTKKYNVVLFSPTYISGGMNKNFKEVFVAGDAGNNTIIPIPYTIGSAIVG